MTTEQQAMMEQAAQEGASRCCESEAYGYVAGFPDGASFYEEKILPGELAKAMEWISLKGLYQEIDGRWYDKFGGKVRIVAETTKELLTLFEKYKHNQDAD